MKASQRLNNYFKEIEKKTMEIYKIAQKAKEKGYDPVDQVEIPLASDLASRIEGLISSIIPQLSGTGLADRIRELERKFGKNDDRVALEAAASVAKQEFCKFNSLQEQIEAGLRVGVAYNTLGIVTAPLEGISGLKIKKRRDGKDYLAVYFGGPIRSAGGTANAFAVIIADYLRQIFNIDRYDPTDDEIERYVVELDDYDSKVTNLQYRPYPEEIRFIIKNLPVEINGDPTEKLEVLSYKNLPRIETNRIRSGVCLTISMIAGKAPKLIKKLSGKLSTYNLSSWDFLKEYKKLAEKLHAHKDSSSDNKKDKVYRRVEPSYKYMVGLPGGRPVFSYPSRNGGFRLRYGRSRNTGFAACGFHPATMIISDCFIAIGTQIKLERPGKATVSMPVDTIEGPIVKLKNGNVMRIKDINTAYKIKKDIEEILYMGDILIGYGEFLTNGHVLLPAPWCEEWWEAILREKLKNIHIYPDKLNNSDKTTTDPIIGERKGTNVKRDTTNNKKKKQAKNISTPTLIGFLSSDNITHADNKPQNPNKISEDNIYDILKAFMTATKENIYEFHENLTFLDALKISKKLQIPLHPRFVFYYTSLDIPKIIELIKWLSTGRFSTDMKVFYVALSSREKRFLELCGVEHSVISGTDIDNNIINKNQDIHQNFVSIEHDSLPLLYCLGIIRLDEKKGFYINKNILYEIDRISSDINAIKSNDGNPVLTLINKLSDVEIKDKGATFIGARMGRPEKAERRLMPGKPHVLFPVGRDTSEEKKQRSITKASGFNRVKVELSLYYCHSCKRETFYTKCDICQNKTKKIYYCKKCRKKIGTDFCQIHKIPAEAYSEYNLDFSSVIETATKKIGVTPSTNFKGVQGLISKDKIPERLEKGILRANYNLTVNKDGTIRFDATDCPVTYFTPKEVSVSVDKLRELGYTHDYLGNPLEKDDQILELLPQDFLISDFVDNNGKIISGAEYFVNICKFIDDTLEKLYGLERYYNVEKKEDLIGHIMVTLAPHTSAGIVGRIVGFTPARVFYCHPMLIAARRRNADGDEDSMMLALDAFLNFSRKYLPTTKGAGTMDVPLVLTLLLDPSEIDDEVWDMDTVWDYPQEFYEATYSYPYPWDIKVETLKERIGSEKQYEQFAFTINTSSINEGPTLTAYKSAGNMIDKVIKQLELAKKIRAVDHDSVADIVLTSHFLKDIKGNIRSFTQQRVRCIACNTSYRRIPLTGRCENPGCNGKLVLTVHEATATKYLPSSIEVANSFKLPKYVEQQLKLLEYRIETMFGKEKYEQKGLSKFFSIK